MSKYSPWQQQFETMAKKTVLAELLRTYGIMSTEMMQAVSNDSDYNYPEQEQTIEQEIEAQGNKIDYETGEIIEQVEEIKENEKTDLPSELFGE